MFDQTTPRIQSLACAVPERRYTQHQIHALNPWEDNALIDKLFLDSAVHSRGLFVPPEWYQGNSTLSQTNQAWKEGALLLGGQVLVEACQNAGLALDAVDQLGVTTVTGYATPGLDLLLAKAHGLRRDVARAHFNCIGCHAAIPLLRVMADGVRARPTQKAVALAVEICSACFSEDPTPQNLVALSLFADGAAAAVLGVGGNGPLLVDFYSAFNFEHLDALGFGLTAEGFRIVLDPSIPNIVGAGIREVVETLLERHDLTVADVGCWCFHPGGARILDEVQRNLQLTERDMRPSRRVLRSHGNMSSPSVLFVLANAMAHQRPRPGSWGVLAAFGPGLGIEAALIHFDA